MGEDTVCIGVRDVVLIPYPMPQGLAMSKKKNKKTTFWGRLGRLLAVTAAAIVVLVAAVVLLFRWVPPPSSAFMINMRLSGTTVDYRWVPMKRISPQAALAVVASEDQRFFDHWGIDVAAITDAIEDNRTRKRPRGASTISQQVVKNLFLWPGASYVRKGIEAGATLLVEALWPKSRILEVYLNIAEMGPGIFGVEAAAQRFYGKPAARLNRREAAMLAAVLPNPTAMSAARPSNYVIRRTWQIMDQMHRLGGTAFLKPHLP